MPLKRTLFFGAQLSVSLVVHAGHGLDGLEVVSLHHHGLSGCAGELTSAELEWALTFNCPVLEVEGGFELLDQLVVGS